MVIKAKAFLALATLGLVLPLTGTLGVRAAETDATSQASDSELVGKVGSPATGSAKVQVEPGELAFKKDAKDSAIVPSFVFNNPTVGKPQSDLSLKSDVIDMEIENNQGTGSSWQVDVSLGELITRGKDGGSHTLNGATLNLKPTVKGNQLSNPGDTIHVSAGGQAKSLLIANPGAGMNNVSLSLAGTTLSLPTTTWAGNYTASLTYTLTSGPTGTSAN